MYRVVIISGYSSLDIDPFPGYVEQVYFYELASKTGTNESLVALVTAQKDKAFVVRFDVKQLPCFSQWKMTGSIEEGYVTGLEPATNYPNSKKFERKQGRVVSIHDP